MQPDELKLYVIAGLHGIHGSSCKRKSFELLSTKDHRVMIHIYLSMEHMAMESE